MAVLDDLSGFEFEDVMEDVFRNLGYENVRQASRTADEGRDIIMEEVVDGTRRGIVIECKHTGTVGRPVIQKLHSAIATFDFDGPKRGMVATTGRFTGPAREYAERLDDTDDPYPIQLIDGRDLREIADEVGIDLYNGRIEILCTQTHRPFDPAGDIDAPVREAFRDVKNIDPARLPEPHAQASLEPIVVVTARADATFETSVGIIHRLDETTSFVVHAGRTHPRVLDNDVSRLVTDNLRRTIELDERALEAEFDAVDVNRFGQTETEYKEWTVDRLREYHTTTVTYTGDNNVTYNKTCEPTQSDIAVQSVTPVYLPDVRQTTRLQQYSYPYQYYVAGPSRITTEDGIHRCVHCDDESASTFTYCDHCGSINCETHIQTERLEKDPVCTGCAITERFALKTKYFSDEENLETFREEYEAMAPHRKAMENKPLAASAVISALLVVAMLLVSSGLL
ncbi:restriction endonuclease [Natrinema sp. SYSU A 869]|uniref:restriction endonuclease n=1 Tax=Natrinema sp. SYSU A 869 TaxID=2871694 RepID=UPI001CA40C41|nr:restriction endonuclease [Natrinema sp. SYSU A 869]